ncbi:IS110 family transposase [Xenorhabdus khoisanae]|uniref:IS110 family transposase n=1 Tax=Xenorhabdus khoisanae TaxID=880157 RepID=UPI002359D58C|nr:IS110 family transposase [Xenorhabdus khoisanae]MDC9616399.1 IS110 family transposase [Xenorhabdus khoisanae]
MLNSLQPQDSVILGVDTHLEMHVGAIIDRTGKLLGTRTVETNLAGYQQLLSWAQTWGTVNQAGIEGTGTYGAGLTRFLIKNGIEVLEITRPDRSMRRQNGKSDPLDAECAARTVLSGRTRAIPKQQSGISEALRITGVARRSAVKAKTQAINQIRALLVSAPQNIRDALWKSKPHECVNACLMQTELANSLSSQILLQVLNELAQRWKILAAEVAQLDKLQDKLTQQYAKNLRSQYGVGPQTAATLLAVAGDNPERLKSEAALAALCGVNPLPASSGKTVRHRLNRGGSREANNALWTIALVRMRSDPRTKIYVQRRTKEGLSTKEILRCLKRYIIRELYPLILADLKYIP